MVKVLLALESAPLRELLKDLVEREPGLALAGEVEVADPIDLLVGVKKTQADVVVQTWQGSEEMPGICSHLLTEFPDLLVIGVPRHGDHAFVCRQTIDKRRVRTTELHDLLLELCQTAPALK